HSYSHVPFTGIGRLQKEKEIIECRQILKNITGDGIAGFRAPYNCIDMDTFSVLEKEGFLYDASIIDGLGLLFPDIRDTDIGEIPISSVFGIPMEDVIWLYYLKMPGAYFYILENKRTGMESYLFHPHHIAKHKEEFEQFINHLKEENVIFISHRELIETYDEGVQTSRDSS
ncbi:TPA: polysaccharide deacetylase family protein, partial [Candidatus Woesearchaeota archaeon]|nr:polysaccharide deacetylase family protein [Candidatus Woesearchaeota archaeon]